MAICLSCGLTADECLCKKCQNSVDIEKLCDLIEAYSQGKYDAPDKNPTWESIASEMGNPQNFKKTSFAVANYLQSPRKEYRQILSLTGSAVRVPRSSKIWFWDTYSKIKDSDSLTNEENLRLKGLYLEALYQDYRYFEAEELAQELLDKPSVPLQTAYTIAEFFSQTRRYEEARKVIEIAEPNCKNTNTHFFDKIKDINEKRANGGIEYQPKDAEAKQKYSEFMSTRGIEITSTKKSKNPTPIPNGDYPETIEKREDDFDSFVAFDFETTGTTPAFDSIIEVGAIKVIHGKIVESADFTFSEFVKPYEKKISSEITDLTGISQDDVKDAREMWEVIPDFMKFVGDNILVGFNNIRFDAKFLRRAGRYSNEIYTNKHFDVLRYIKSNKDELNLDCENLKLETASACLGIENPEAHRALADAITTARVYLKLREMRDSDKSGDADFELDINEW